MLEWLKSLFGISSEDSYEKSDESKDFVAWVDCEVCLGACELADKNFRPYPCPHCNGRGGKYIASPKHE